MVAVVPLGGAIGYDITVILVGMRGSRPALSTTSWCIFGVPWPVPCSAPQGGGGEGMCTHSAGRV